MVSRQCTWCRFAQEFYARDMAEELTSYLESLPPEIKVDRQEHQRRLAICSKCDATADAISRRGQLKKPWRVRTPAGRGGPDTLAAARPRTDEKRGGNLSFAFSLFWSLYAMMTRYLLFVDKETIR